jgi:hypothetical protein
VGGKGRFERAARAAFSSERRSGTHLFGLSLSLLKGHTHQPQAAAARHLACLSRARGRARAGEERGGVGAGRGRAHEKREVPSALLLLFHARTRFPRARARAEREHEESSSLRVPRLWRGLRARGGERERRARKCGWFSSRFFVRRDGSERLSGRAAAARVAAATLLRVCACLEFACRRRNVWAGGGK